MRRNLNRVRDSGTIPLYFPDEFKGHFRMTRETCVAYMHFRTTYESLPWLRCKSGAKEHSSHPSHNNKRNTDIEQKNWKPCRVRFPGSEKLGASRNGRMERNFPVIPIFRNLRPTSRGTPKISE